MALVADPVMRDWAARYGTAAVTSRLQAAGHKVAYIVQVPKTGNITTLHFSLTACASDATIIGSLETLSSGRPSGSAYGGSASGELAVASSGFAAGAYSITLSTAAAATRGALMAVVFTLKNAGTPDCTFAGGVAHAYQNLPMVLRDVGSGWVLLNERTPMCTLGYDDTSVAVPMGGTPVVTATTWWAYNLDTSTYDEYGLRFTVPTARGIGGAALNVRPVNGQNAEVILYRDPAGASPAPLATVVVDGTIMGTSGTWIVVDWGEDVALSPAEVYGITYRPATGATTDHRLQYLTVNPAAAMAGWVGSGYHAIRRVNNSGAFNMDLTNTVPMIVPLYTQVDDGTSTGGGGILSGALTGGRQI